jgi:hypothetical protein
VIGKNNRHSGELRLPRKGFIPGPESKIWIPGRAAYTARLE